MNLKTIKNFSNDNFDILIGLILFISIFTVYIKYLAPSVLLGDPADFTIAAYTLGIPHPNGFPVYTWIGHIFTLIPFGSVSYKINMMSAFFAALTVSLTYTIIIKITTTTIKSNNNYVYRLFAIIAAFSLAFSKTFWSQSEFAEVYTFSAFFILLMIFILIKWSENENPKYLYIFALIFGLSIGAHLSNIIFTPALLIFIIITNYKTLNNKNLILMGLLFLIGISQFLYLLIRAGQHPLYAPISSDLNEWWAFITCKQYAIDYFKFSVHDLPGRIWMYITLLKSNFSNTGIILGLIGMVGLFIKNKRILVLLISIFLLNIGFYVNYHVFDVNTMFIPSFLIFSVLIGFGLIGLFDLIKKGFDKWKVQISYKNSHIGLLSVFTVLIFVFALLNVPISAYQLNYEEIDQLDNDNFALFAYTALNKVPKNATIVTYWRSFTVFKYFQIVDNLRPDVNVIPAEGDNLVDIIENNGENVFVVHDTKGISMVYNITPVVVFSNNGVLYKVNR